MKRRQFIKNTLQSAVAVVIAILFKPNIASKCIEPKAAEVTKALTPSVVINGVKYDIVPNSFCYDGSDSGSQT
jgi:hypothetical protein